MKKTILSLVIVAVTTTANASVLPETPVPFKSGTGVTDGQTIYIGLGSAGTAWYKMDTQAKDKKWINLAAFPGGAREQATSVILDGKIYIFGGTGKNEQGLMHVYNDVYMYKPEENTWQKLMSHSPLGLTGHVTFVHNGKAIVLGGVNQNIFNGYFVDINAAGENKNILNKINEFYFGKRAEDYLYGKTMLSFDPSTQQWNYIEDSPFSGTAGATVVKEGNKAILINGEIKPGLRTDKVFSVDFADNKIKWGELPAVSSPDGVAGGYGGMSHGAIIFAGGAAFPGSGANYVQGKNYAHEGLSKKYSDDIYLYQHDQWLKAGKLPEGMAYGVSLPWEDGLLMIGGEKDGGQGISASVWVGLKDNHLKVEN